MVNPSRRRSLRESIAKLPVIGPAAKKIYRAIVLPQPELKFNSSPQYWDDRYARGGNSGAGSYGRLALFKAEILNKFVVEHDIQTVVEFGSGDGAQLELARYPYYTGIDVSLQAVEICKAKFRHDPNKNFLHTSSPMAGNARADLAMSLDVIYHLVEDDIYHTYMSRLFSAAEKFVCLYSSNVDRAGPVVHVRHRCFTDWIARHAHSWSLVAEIPNPYPEDPDRPADTSWADFYFFAINSQPRN
jgi:hypothetical protein